MVETIKVVLAAEVMEQLIRLHNGSKPSETRQSQEGRV